MDRPLYTIANWGLSSSEYRNLNETLQQAIKLYPERAAQQFRAQVMHSTFRVDESLLIRNSSGQVVGALIVTK